MPTLRQRILPSLAFGLFALFGVAACSEQPVGLPHPPDILRWPTSMEIGPDGQYAFVVNSNFDQKYRSGAMVVVDLVSGEVLSETTLNVPAFGGRISAGKTGESANFDRLFLPSRTSDELYEISIDWGSEGALPGLDCGGPVIDGLKTCAEEHILAAPAEESQETQPYASAVIEDASGNELIVTAGLSNGTVYFWSRDSEATLQLIDQIDIGPGIQSIVFHPQQGALLFTHKDLAILSVLPLSIGVAEGGLTVEFGDYQAIAMPHNPAGSDFGRGMVLHPDGVRVIVAWRSPSSLLVLEPDAESAGGYRLTDQIDVGLGAGQIALLDTGAEQGVRAFVTSFIEDKVYSVNLDSGEVDGFTNVGRGPYAIRVVQSIDGTRRWLLTADFEDGTLSVLQGDASAADYFQIIKTIGASEEE